MINEKSADTQLELKKRIEEKTAAKVHFELRFSAEEKFTARIVREHFLYCLSAKKLPAAPVCSRIASA